jgi:hypothetical protein
MRNGIELGIACLNHLETGTPTGSLPIQRLSYSVLARRQETGIDHRRLPVLLVFHLTVPKQSLGTYHLATQLCLPFLTIRQPIDVVPKKPSVRGWDWSEWL